MSQMPRPSFTISQTRGAKEPMSINRRAAAAFWLSTIALSMMGPKAIAPASAAVGHLVHRRQREPNSYQQLWRCAVWNAGMAQGTERPEDREAEDRRRKLRCQEAYSAPPWHPDRARP